MEEILGEGGSDPLTPPACTTAANDRMRIPKFARLDSINSDIAINALLPLAIGNIFWPFLSFVIISS